MRGARRRGMGVNNKTAVMKTSWGKPVHVISFCRTLLVTLSVGVCLATLMGCGNKPEKDASPAADDIETLRKAAEQGNADAQYDFGVLYADGEGVPSDSAEAAKWYRKAAEQGHAQAQYTLGEMCENDFNFRMYKSFTYSEGYAEAVKWYRKAAEQGHAEAQFNLAVKYDTGEEGVPEDDAEAAKWYRKAAEQGHAWAQYRLGVMYRYGRGVPQDYVAAYAWYIVAAASGDEDGRKNRDIIKRDLTPSQLEKGQVMAREIFERIEKRKAEEGQ